MATVGMVLFLFAGGLFASALNMGAALLLTATWPRVRLAWRPGVAAWLVNAVGLTINFTVVDTWLLGVTPVALMTARLTSAGIALGTAAIVSFAVLRLRRAQGWVFFLVLALLAIPLSMAATRT
jgi:hypothetical protein